jgi:hypothetical protein
MTHKVTAKRFITPLLVAVALTGCDRSPTDETILLSFAGTVYTCAPVGPLGTCAAGPAAAGAHVGVWSAGGLPVFLPRLLASTTTTAQGRYSVAVSVRSCEGLGHLNAATAALDPWALSTPSSRPTCTTDLQTIDFVLAPPGAANGY